jgi:hypothetical protein
LFGSGRCHRNRAGDAAGIPQMMALPAPGVHPGARPGASLCPSGDGWVAIFAAGAPRVANPVAMEPGHVPGLP